MLRATASLIRRLQLCRGVGQLSLEIADSLLNLLKVELALGAVSSSLIDLARQVFRTLRRLLIKRYEAGLDLRLRCVGSCEIVPSVLQGSPGCGEVVHKASEFLLAGGPSRLCLLSLRNVDRSAG